MKSYNDIPFDDSWSNCCGAQIVPEQKRCADCQEHCDVLKDCEKCKGLGTIGLDNLRLKDCLNCNAKGYVRI